MANDFMLYGQKTVNRSKGILPRPLSSLMEYASDKELQNKDRVAGLHLYI